MKTTSHSPSASIITIIIITQLEMCFMRLHQQMSNTSFEAIVTLFLSIDHVTGYFVAPGSQRSKPQVNMNEMFCWFFPFLF